MEDTTPAPADVEETSSAPVENAEVQPSGSEAVKNTEEQKQYVPLERFQEVNNQLKEFKQELESLKPQAPEGPEIDPETAKILEGWASQNGFVRQSDLEKREAAAQAERDLLTVKQEFSLSEEDLLKVRDDAVKAGATNIQGLRNAYFAKQYSNIDKIVEERVNQALAKADSPESFAEKPGTGGAQKPTEEVKQGSSLRDRIKAAARNV